MVEVVVIARRGWGERINSVCSDEVLSVSPEIAAVACPYCSAMLKDGVGTREAGDRVKVMGIVEILQSVAWVC